MSNAQTKSIRWSVLVALALGSTTVLGCALFKGGGDEIQRETPAPAAREAIALDIAVARRPIDDALLGRVLWDDVDESGVLEPVLRKRLNDNGFRIGVAGSALPSALQTILRESLEENEPTTPTWKNEPGHLPGSSRVTLFHGRETLIEASGLIDELTLADADPSADGSPTLNGNRLKNARCMMRITAEKIQDGWVELRFLPEIYYGEKSRRAVADAGQLTMREQQRVQPLYEYQFKVMLNPGEVAIVGSSAADGEALGRRIFADTSGRGISRLLAVRFAETTQVHGVREQVTE